MGITRRKCTLLAFVVGLWTVGAGCSPQVGAQSAETERTFEFSKLGDVEILSVGRNSSQTPQPHRRFALFGDGRLVCRTVLGGPDRTEVEPPVEVYLSPFEVHEIIARIVRAGLLEYDEQRAIERLGGSFTVVEPGGIVLRIGLLSYRGERRKETKPFSHTIEVLSPGLVIREYQQRLEAGHLPADAPETFVEVETLVSLHEQLGRLSCNDD